jgi:hypothetical protein
MWVAEKLDWKGLTGLQENSKDFPSAAFCIAHFVVLQSVLSCHSKYCGLTGPCITLSYTCTVRSESRCALRQRYVGLVISVETSLMS